MDKVTTQKIIFYCH